MKYKGRPQSTNIEDKRRVFMNDVDTFLKESLSMSKKIPVKKKRQDRLSRG